MPPPVTVDSQELVDSRERFALILFDSSFPGKGRRRRAWGQRAFDQLLLKP